ncbi:MAG TPA: N-acetylmuramoyl-L-alanine amidase [bacterium]|nr:N-acetylmuramoyl-L-alanine amidase [bacterium]
MSRNILFLLALLCSLTLDASLSGKKICVDPGHGGTDPGALGVNGSVYPDEADLVLDIDLRFRTLLTADDASVLMTRDADTTVSLANRVDQANAWGATIFLATHLNSADLASASGTETFAYQSGGTSASLATTVQNELIDHMGRVDRGVKYESFYVIKYTDMPAILSEGVFVSNSGDFTYITSGDGKEAHAVALYHAVCSHFGVTPQDPGSGGDDPGAVKGFVYNLTTGLGNVEGNRIADATVTITPTSGSPSTLTTPATGLFSFTGVEPGDYTLSVEKNGFVTAQKSITVTSNADTWASTGIEEESAQATATVKGFVYDLSTGLGNIEENRIAGATVTIKNNATSAETIVPSSETGYFSFAGLEAGNYTLTVTKTGYQNASRTLDLVAGDNWASTGIEKESGVTTGGVTGTVYALTMLLNPSGIAGATVTLTPAGGGADEVATTDANGAFSFTGVPAGDHTLTAEASGYQTAQKDITVVAAQTLEIGIGLSPIGGADDEAPTDDGLATDDITLPDDLLPDEEETPDDEQPDGGGAVDVEMPAAHDDAGATADEDLFPEGPEEEGGCACALVALP